MKNHKLFFEYLRTSHLKIITSALLITIMPLISLLWGAHPDGVIYATVINIVILFCAWIIDFLRFYRKHKLLTEAALQVKDNLDILRSAATSLSDKEWLFLIERLNDEHNQSDAEHQKKMRDMSEYFTLWVHQIKTPLAAMRILLSDSSQNADELNDSISEQVFRTEEYVSMAMQYIRIEEKASDYLLRAVDVDSVIRSALRKYARLFIKKKLTLDYIPTDLTVISDEKWLLFVIGQILSNSLKYTPKFGKVKICRGSEGNSIEISDTGIGISADDIPRVFEKGYTGSNGRSEKFSSGIGLYLCRVILTRLSHKISITSSTSEPRGTTVTLYFDN